MKMRLLGTLLTLVLIVNLAGVAYAAGASRTVYADGAPVGQAAAATEYRSGTTYVALRAVTTALSSQAAVTWENGQAVVHTPNLSLTARPGDCYIQANGRCLYVPDGVRIDCGRVMIPVRVLAQALGASVWWDSATSSIFLTSGSGGITSGDNFYDSSSVYWLSRIISAESQAEPMLGRIAVGNVILNRVASDEFPNTIYDVIFDKNWGVQFTPVSIGSIYWDPTEGSIVAAKLCMEGVNVVGKALYFIKPSAASNLWVAQNRPYVTTIGVHNFYN